MKTTRFLVVLFAPLMATTLRAAPLLNLGSLAAPPPPEISSPQVSDDSQDDPVGTDPDAVPKAFAHPNERPLTAGERTVLQENERKREEQRDWLVHAYERQLQSRDQSESTNLYAELTSNPDLARLAGLKPANYSDTPEIDLRLDASDSSRVMLRSDPSAPPTEPLTPSARPAFDPIVTPLASGERSSISAPFAAPSPITPIFPSFGSPDSSASPDALLDASDPVKNQDPGVLDIPGLTAAESSPATRSAIDLKNEELLPDEFSPADKPHNNLSLDLPPTTNAERLQKIQNTVLGLPNQPAKKTAPSAVSTVTVPPPTDTQEMVPDPSPIRSHLNDPFDILR